MAQAASADHAENGGRATAPRRRLARGERIKEGLDAATWQELPSSNDNKYDEAVDARMQRILQASSLQSLRDIANTCTEQARALCIELEIRANIDTPKEDQGLRMQIQLDQSAVH